MSNKYPTETLHYRLRPQPESPNSTRNRARARNRLREDKRAKAREKAQESYQLSKVKTLTKQHFRAARRKGAPIGWAEARGRAIEQIVGNVE